MMMLPWLLLLLLYAPIVVIPAADDAYAAWPVLHDAARDPFFIDLAPCAFAFVPCGSCCVALTDARRFEADDPVRLRRAIERGLNCSLASTRLSPGLARALCEPGMANAAPGTMPTRI